MKNFLLILLTIGCGAFLFLGNMYWQERTAVSSSEKSPLRELEPSSAPAEKQGIPYSNWPEKAQADYKDAKEKGEAYKLALVGSLALGEESNGWSVQLKDALEEEYGDTLEVSIFQRDTDSLHFTNGDELDEVLSFAPDMVLYEPFSLNNNSLGVSAEDNLDSIDIFQRELTEANKDAVLLLQPTHPIYGATYYPRDVEKLKEYAEEKGITYLNHWKAWPSDESLKNYLVDTQDTPNEEGHSLWVDYLKKYFISEQE
ncbi:hypothetical protein CN378_12500 [Bacillus sp. AFS015802]|uniref:SGNH/GDSL hydrolase family protein n=1 Tax=Bacillus sp. AFS015802 TaxID=2033486 RepID=UPI000BF7F9BC|nr:SGNH/GDSL hydrolase family protein [Bacillus sp. AFS015802]PFA66924.1 hypothetical protein CN378_12500 [Bacillus sp. AFS015802]